MNILLTGGSGFIGSNLNKGLKNKFSIYSPSHHQLDVTNYKEVKKYIKKTNIKVIIHSAVNGSDQDLETTLRMFLSLIRNIDRVDKIIHFGSGAEYDKKRDLIKIKEDQWGNRIPKDPYGLAKYICSEISKNYRKIITLRLFGVFGKGEDYRYKFISNSIAKVLMNLPIVIKQDVVFDYLSIDDLIPIVDRFLTYAPPYSVYNITPTQSITLSKICNHIKTVSQKKFSVKILHKGLNWQYTGNNSRLLQFIPDFRFISYEQGIFELYKFYKKNITMIDKKSLIKDDYLLRVKIKTSK